METDISETGNIGTKGETRGNRDQWRGVRDVTGIEWTLEQKRYSGGRQSGTGFVGGSLVIDI